MLLSSLQSINKFKNHLAGLKNSVRVFGNTIISLTNNNVTFTEAKQSKVIAVRTESVSK